MKNGSMRLTAILIGTFLSVFYLGDVLGQAASALPTGEDLMAEYLQSGTRVVRNWETSGDVVLSITVLIGFAGLITAALQTITNKAAKIVTVTLGIVIGTGTLVNNIVYEQNHKEFYRLGVEGENKINQLRRLQRNYETATEEDKRTILNSAMEIVNQLNAMELQRYGGPDGTGNSGASLLPRLELVSSANAQSASSEAPWLSHAPVNPSYDYFIGKGSAQTLAGAKNLATSDAKNNAAQRYASYTVHPEFKGDFDLGRFSDSVTGNLSTESSYFVKNKQTNQYDFYTLEKIPKSTVRDNLFEQVSDAQTDISGVRCVQFVLDDRYTSLPKEVKVAINGPGESRTVIAPVVGNEIVLPLTNGASAATYEFTLDAPGYASSKATATLSAGLAGERILVPMKRPATSFLERWTQPSKVSSLYSLPAEQCVLASKPGQ